MLLGSDRDADSGGPAHDEKGTGHSGNPGTQALARARGPADGGVKPASGQDMTTRNPAMRRRSGCHNAVSLPSPGCSTRVA